MKHVITLLTIMLILLCRQASAEDIDIKLKGTTHTGGSRLPSATRIYARKNSRNVTLVLKCYIGNVQIYISDEYGNIVGNAASEIHGTGNVNIDLGDIDEGTYYMEINLSNATYYGQFEN